MSSPFLVLNKMVYKTEARGISSDRVGIGTSIPAVALEINSTDAVLLPKGTILQRPLGVSGYIRYNTELDTFEGFGAGDAWGSLGGVKSTDQLTYITAENDCNIRFYTGGQQRAILNSNGHLGIGIGHVQYPLHVNGDALVTDTLYACNIVFFNHIIFSSNNAGLNYNFAIQPTHYTEQVSDVFGKSNFSVSVPGQFKVEPINTYIYVNGSKLGYINQTSNDYTLTYQTFTTNTLVDITFKQPVYDTDVVDIVIYPTTLTSNQVGYFIQNINTYWEKETSPDNIYYTSGNVGIGTTLPQEKLHLLGNLFIEGNMIPSACNVYDIGTSNLRFRDIYLSGNTIDLGGTLISRNSANGQLIVSTQSGEPVDISANSISVLSSNLVTNLNAQYLNGKEESFYTNATNITDGNLAVIYGGTGSTSVTGTGSNVLSDSPTLTGTVQAANLTASGTVSANAITVSSSNLVTNLNAQYLNGKEESFYTNATNITDGNLAVIYGGTGSTSVTGTGSNVLSASPTLTGTVQAANLTASGTVAANSFQVTSTGLVTNLNADLLDGQQGSFYQNATNITDGALNPLYGGTGATFVTGTGSNVLSDSPTLTGTVQAANLTASGTVAANAITVASTGLVTNLNADLLDNQQGSYYTNVNNMDAGTLPIARGGTGQTSLTANKVLVGNNTSGILQPANLHWDSATNRLGINNQFPSNALDVVGNAYISGTITASNLSIIGDFVTMNTVTSNTEQMVINNIGTGPALRVTQTGNTPLAEFFDSESGSAMFIDNNGLIGFSTNVPLAKLYVLETGSVDAFRVDDQVSDTTPFIIKADGNVGVGKTNPVGALDVNGTVTTGNINANGTLTMGGVLSIQNSVDGGTTRGIRLWNAENSDWGIYMASSGASKSLAGTTAIGPDSITGIAIRSRIWNNAQSGFIWENSSESRLMSLNANSGNLVISGTLTSGAITSTTINTQNNNITMGTGNLIVGNVGVGTNSPIAPIHVMSDGIFYHTQYQGVGGRIRGYVHVGVVGGLKLESRQANGTYVDTMNLSDSGLVGIGLTNPQEKLQVEGFVRSSSGYKVGTTTIIDSSANLTNIGNISSGAITSTTINTQNNNITMGTGNLTVGNVGVGTTISSEYRIDCIGPSRITGVTVLATSTNGAALRITRNPGNTTNGDFSFIGLNIEQQSTWSKSAIGKIRTTAYDVGDIVFLQNEAFDGSDCTMSHEKMRITSGGSVGISTNNPQERLHIEGNIALSGAARFIGTRTNHNLTLRTNNTDRVTIDTNGNVGIGVVAGQRSYTLSAVDTGPGSVGVANRNGDTIRGNSLDVASGSLYVTAWNGTFISGDMTIRTTLLRDTGNNGTVGGTYKSGDMLIYTGDVAVDNSVANAQTCIPGNILFGTGTIFRNNGAIVSGTNPIWRMAINGTSGFIGIGTTSPQELLHIEGGFIRSSSGYKVGSTTVIDSSRNITNIGSISSTSLTLLGSIVFRQHYTIITNDTVRIAIPYIKSSSWATINIYVNGIGTADNGTLGARYTFTYNATISVYGSGLEVAEIVSFQRKNSVTINTYINGTNDTTGILYIEINTEDGFQQSVRHTTDVYLIGSPQFTSFTTGTVTSVVNTISDNGYTGNFNIGTLNCTTVNTSGNITIGNTTTKVSDSILTIASDGENLWRQGIRLIHHGDGNANQFGWYLFGSDIDDRLHLGSYSGGTTETDRIVIDRSSGQVGVGTTNPQGLLHLYSATTSPSQHFYSKLLGNLNQGAVSWILLCRSSGGGRRLEGRIFTYRDVGSSYDNSTIIQVHCGANQDQTTTYASMYLQQGGNNLFDISLVTVTYNSVVYLAIKFNSTSAFIGYDGAVYFTGSLTHMDELLVVTNSGLISNEAAYTTTRTIQRFTGNVNITNGSVGIGTVSPQSLLDVRGIALIGSDMQSGGAYNSFATVHARRSNKPHIIIESIGSQTGGIALNNGDGLVYGFDGTGSHIFRTGVTGTGDFTTTGTERMRINSSGSVGIGTTAPRDVLDVVGTVRATGGTFTGSITIDGSVQSSLGYRVGDVEVIDSSGNIVAGGLNLVSSSGTPALTVTAAGNVGIGTATPVAALHVNGIALFRVPVVIATGGNSQSFTGQVSTKVTLTASVDTINCFSNSRYTPNIAGYYQVSAQSGLQLTNNYLVISILVNNVAVVSITSPASSGNYPIEGLSTLIYLNGTTDYVELFVTAQSTGTSTGSRLTIHLVSI